eukprot:TRINITY_DN4421_c0_g1_i1.p1 TRINITY_DN4421_c0_g1~~TRINITY_DN4421_c0_g1_i1.p1  ORF type:complete len:255 (+),score=63.16 TRINITY_DN4421_c0_g1_i1:36-800(+)
MNKTVLFILFIIKIIICLEPPIIGNEYETKMDLIEGNFALKNATLLSSERYSGTMIEYYNNNEIKFGSYDFCNNGNEEALYPGDNFGYYTRESCAPSCINSTSTCEAHSGRCGCGIGSPWGILLLSKTNGTSCKTKHDSGILFTYNADDSYYSVTSEYCVNYYPNSKKGYPVYWRISSDNYDYLYGNSKYYYEFYNFQSGVPDPKDFTLPDTCQTSCSNGYGYDPIDMKENDPIDIEELEKFDQLKTTLLNWWY